MAPLGVIFTVILAVHSFFGGLVIGLQTTLHSTIINFIAFGVHKAVAGYALGIDLSCTEVGLTAKITQCVVFALSTPTGVAVGVGILAAVPSRVGATISACFGAASAGSFMCAARRA